MLHREMKADNVKGSASACGMGMVEGIVRVHGKSYCSAWALQEGQVWKLWCRIYYLVVGHQTYRSVMNKSQITLRSSFASSSDTPS